MKRILSIVLVLVFALACLVACDSTSTSTPDTSADTSDNTPAEKTYSLALAVDTAVSNKNKVSNTAMVLILDADNKIVAARIDTVEATPALDNNGALVTQESVSSKVELGDAYTGMAAGSWEKQVKAFETWLVGKSAADIAGTEFTKELIAGCTMTSSMATFKALAAEAFASELKVTFKTSDAISTGIALSTAVASGKGGKVTVTTDVASIAIVDGKVAATAIDSIEQSFTIADGALVASELAASKNEKGEAYTGMPAGAWYKQAAAFANSTVGKTVAELNDLETVSDALAAAGCTMKNTTEGYKTTIIKAANNAK